MKRDLHNDSFFESFLKQSADQLQMRPSARVWGSISRKINNRRRWWGFGIGALLLVSSLLTYYSLDHMPAPAPPATNNNNTDSQVGHMPISATTAPGKTTAAVSHTKPALSTTRTSLLASAKPAASTPADNTDNTFDPLFGADRQHILSEVLLTPALPLAGAGLYNKLYKNSFAIAAITPPDNTLTDKTTAISKPGRKRKFSMQLTFTPNISYRKLSENKSYQIASQSVAPGSTPPFSFRPSGYTINNAVTHKPNMGLEVGLVTKYALNKNIAIRSGVQFNMNRYEVKAFNYVPELTTIALNSQYLPDSVNALSSYRNYNNNGNNWLQNLYFQVAIPVGLEVNLHNDDKFQFGIASTVQPTYVFGDHVYLLSTDYKHYAEVPWLIRRWNVNTSFETFVAYSSGHIKWQVGPQVRYQLLSSFINKYPVKENLFDFGLKVGVSLNK